MDLDSLQGTPLHAAAIAKDHDIIKILLEHHADVRHQFLGSLMWAGVLVLHLYILCRNALEWKNLLHLILVIHLNKRFALYLKQQRFIMDST